MARIEARILILGLLIYIRNVFADASKSLTPVKHRVYQPFGEKMELSWRYSSLPEPTSFVFSRTNNEKNHEGKVIGEWSNKDGFKQDKDNLKTETQLKMTKEDGGYQLITLVLVNPCSEDYDKSYYCEIKDKNYSSKIIVDLERPQIEHRVSEKNGNQEFLFIITYSKKLAAFILERRLRTLNNTEEICYILFGELSIEDQFKDRVKCNKKEIDKKEIFTITMSNFTYQDSGEYSGYFVFYGGDNNKLLFNISSNESYSQKRATTEVLLPEMKSNSSFTFSIIPSFYYTVIMQYFFYFLLIDI